MGDISPEERLAIATKFLLSSPPGEFDVVLRDVKELLADNELLKTRAEGIFRAYHTDQMVPVAVPGSDHSIVLTKLGEVDPTHYIDPATEQVVTVDHINTTATGVRPFGPGEGKFSDRNNAPYRQALNDAIQGYAKDHFSNGVGTVYATTDGGCTLTVAISATKASPRNFWSGRWRSVWTITFTPGRSAEVELKGTIKVQGHYYEEGNVQLNGNVERSTQVQVTANAAETAGAIAEAIAKQENEYQSSVEAVYLNMKAFQSLRRKLPVHAEKFNWDSLAAHRVASSINRT